MDFHDCWIPVVDSTVEFRASSGFCYFLFTKIKGQIIDDLNLSILYLTQPVAKRLQLFGMTNI